MTDVTYAFTNRTSNMLFTRDAFNWLRGEIISTLNVVPVPVLRVKYSLL